MKTRVLKVDLANPEKEHIKEAAKVLIKGGLVVIPTETVYGIAADSEDKGAMARLTEIKKRPPDKPFSLHLALKQDVERYASDILPAAYRLMESFWPGPLTLVFKAKDNAKVGIRIPNHKIALAVIQESGVPLVCPSANLSGNPAPQTAGEALKDIDGLVDLVLDAGKTDLGKESTVVDVSQLPVVVLREGVILAGKVTQVAHKKTVLFVCTGNSCRSVMAKELLEKKLKEGKRQDVQVLSAGIMLLGGLGATDPTRELLKREGIDVSAHRSQGVTPEMIKQSELILVMEKLHEVKVLELVPEAKNRLFLLKEFAEIKDSQLDIADPIGKPYEYYSQTFTVIKEAIERIAQLI